ncbi:MAG: hypothetical protein HY814_09550 [Candidatus Riflebacteria bacterium]|nr:hypothetical protein [Candidatus Riflebacteria bacterium]
MRNTLRVVGMVLLGLLVAGATTAALAKAPWAKMLGVKCMECHDKITKEEAKTSSKPAFKPAQQMVALTDAANAALKTEVKMTCFGCHRGQMKVAKAADDKVPSEKPSPDVEKQMKEATDSLNAKFKDALKSGPITCGTCHQGKGKVPEKP